MENLMDDTRSPREVEAIRQLCAAYKLDDDMAADPKCDLIEFSRRLKMIQAVRYSMHPRIECTVGI